MDLIIWGNSLINYISAIVIVAASIVLIKIISKIIFYRLEKISVARAGRFNLIYLTRLEKIINPAVYYTAFYFSVNRLVLHQTVFDILRFGLIFFLTMFVVRAISLTVSFYLSAFEDNSDSFRSPIPVHGVTTTVKILLWILALVFLLDNLGFKISAVVTGLGIGGVAIALASQAVLGDLFSYFVILMDKPFKTGNVISIGDKKGTVEQIGIKTTKIRSLSGEMMVFSNKYLTDSQIHNFGEMSERRSLFTIGVTYQTPREKVVKIPSLIQKFIEAEEDVRFDRVHFKEYGDSGLIFEISFFVQSADYIIFMDKVQSVNLKIFNEFAKRGIDFAYPTRTLFIEGGSAVKPAKVSSKR